MKKFILAVALLWASALLLQAGEVEGILLDKMCSDSAVKKGMKTAQAHTRDCALMDSCVKAGYGVYTNDGKFLSFDAEGNKKALAALKATSKKTHLRVKVNGEQTGDQITVRELKLL